MIAAPIPRRTGLPSYGRFPCKREFPAPIRPFYGLLEGHGQKTVRGQLLVLQGASPHPAGRHDSKKRPPSLHRRPAPAEYSQAIRRLLDEGDRERHLIRVSPVGDLDRVYDGQMIHTKGMIQMNRKPMKIKVRIPKTAQDANR